MLLVVVEGGVDHEAGAIFIVLIFSRFIDSEIWLFLVIRQGFLYFLFNVDLALTLGRTILGMFAFWVCLVDCTQLPISVLNDKLGLG